VPSFIILAKTSIEYHAKSMDVLHTPPSITYFKCKLFSCPQAAEISSPFDFLIVVGIPLAINLFLKYLTWEAVGACSKESGAGLKVIRFTLELNHNSCILLSDQARDRDCLPASDKTLVYFPGHAEKLIALSANQALAIFL